MVRKPRILFVCTGNSARSQMAEAWTRYYGGDQVIVASAGIDPVGVNPYSVWAMNEVGIDISSHTSDPLSSQRLNSYDLVITLCGHARDACPVLPEEVNSEHWDLADPAQARGKPLEVLTAFRAIRNQLEEGVKGLLRSTLG